MVDDSGARSLRRKILRRRRLRVVGASLLLMGHQSCEVMVPVAIGLAIDGAVDGGSGSTLAVSLLGLTALFLVLTLCYRWFARLSEGAVIDESHTLRVELGARALGPLPSSRARGELLTIASSDADQASRSIVWLSGLFGAGAALALSCIVLLGIDLILGTALILTAVGATLALNALSPVISRRVTAQQETLARASALATDAATGLRVLHGLGAQDLVSARYRETSRAVERAGIRAGTAASVQRGATVLAGSIVLVVSAAFAGLLALEGVISIGSFVAAVGVAQFISEPIGSIGMHLHTGAAALSSAGRVHAVLTEPAPAPQERDPRPPIAVMPGELLGIVVPHAAVEGTIRRLQVPAGHGAHVEPHRADLFAGTIRENLVLGRCEGDPGPALRAAGAEDLVDAHPDGMLRPVRDRGLSLSGGQRQRLTLARSLHADPDVLILNEPTTAVDPVTEQRIAEGIRRLRHSSAGTRRTTVILTSSPILLAASDRVLVAGEGERLNEGTHAELMARDPAYREKVLR